MRDVCKFILCEMGYLCVDAHYLANEFICNKTEMWIVELAVLPDTEVIWEGVNYYTVKLVQLKPDYNKDNVTTGVKCHSFLLVVFEGFIDK